MMEVKQGVYIKDEESFSFDFFADLSAFNKLYFVNSVVDLLVGENYNSIIRDLVFDFYVVDVFTNIDLTEIKESSNFIDDVENLLNETNIVSIVKANIRDGLIEELNEAIDKSIEYKTGIHKSPFDDLGKSLNELVDTIKCKLDGIETDDLLQVFDVLKGIDGEISTQSLIDAYINSDAFKDESEELNEFNDESKKEKMLN